MKFTTEKFIDAKDYTNFGTVYQVMKCDDTILVHHDFTKIGHAGYRSSRSDVAIFCPQNIDRDGWFTTESDALDFIKNNLENRLRFVKEKIRLEAKTRLSNLG